MILKKIGENETEVKIGGLEILFSYNTPVAVIKTNEPIYFETSKKFSVTTTKHINKWWRKKGIEVLSPVMVEQEELEDIIQETWTDKSYRKYSIFV
jgi:hypothetical protein